MNYKKQSLFFRFLRALIKFFTPSMETVWSEPFRGEPSVFVCNHDRAWGPIAMCAHFDHYKDVRPWINAQVLSHKEIPAYVREDFWWPQNKWYTKIFDYTLTYIIALFFPLILKGSACVPVYHDAGAIGTLRSSVDVLQSGYHIILFPEHPTGYKQYGTDIFSGFSSIGRLLKRRTGQTVNFYPTFIDWKAGKISVGPPISYSGDGSHKESSKEISEAVESFFQQSEAASVK